jgi:F0F1-type ATP synthase assembly protein I
MVAVPIALGAWLGQQVDDRLGIAPWGLLALTFVGMALAGLAIAWLIRRTSGGLNPPVSEAAREAGRRWQAEIDEREREREK